MDTDTNPYAAIPLPLDLGSGRTLTALHQTSQLPESTESDPASGWIAVPEGCLLTEVVYDAPHQRACTMLRPLNLASDIVPQINERLP